MSPDCKFVFLFLTLNGCTYAWISPTNIINNKDIVNIPNKVSSISGFGPKENNNTVGDGTTTVMGTNYGYMVPSFAQNILGMNKTGDNDTSSSHGGGNFGSMSGIPNMFANMTALGGNDNGMPFGVIPGIFGNKNKTSGNGTNGSESSESGSNSNSGYPDFSAYIPGLSNKKNKTCGYGNNTHSHGGIPSYFGYIPSAFPSNIFGTNSSVSKNDTSDNSNLLTSGFGSISNIPDKIFGNDKDNKTREKRHCSGCHHGEDHEHDETESRKKRQIGSGLGSLGSLVPGASNLSSLGSALGTGDSGDATLVLGMFQVLVKPIKMPSIDGLMDVINNPQSILTQPQNLLNGGKEERAQVSVVSGALALLLRISTVAGVCPLRFKRERDGWLPFVSPPLAAVQRVVFTVFNGVMLAGFVLDFCQESEKRIRVGETTLKAFVWISDMFLMMMIASIAVYTGPSRMENLIQLLTQIQQVNTELRIRPSAQNEKIKSILIICIVLWAISILIADFYSLIIPLQDNQMWYIMSMYCGYYVGNLLGVLVLLQWCCAVLAVHDAVVAVNEELARLRSANFEMEPIATLEDLLRSPKSGRNTLVDCFTKHKKMNSGVKPSTSISLAQTTIRRLALSQERISELTRQLNATNGIFLMFVLMSTFLRLVLTPYYLLLRFDHDVKGLYETLLQMNWSLFHVVTLLVTIEPCHWTQEQRERTQILLSQLVVHLAPKSEALSRELDQFAKQILLGNPKYMPLGVYALARPLMATILGGVTTYLVIIVQFQKISDQL